MPKLPGVTMFEKEAEEYANGKGHENYENTGCLFDFARLCFQDGAEFGYNKALEEATHNYNAIIADYDKRIAELKKRNAELKSIADFQTTSNMDRYFQLKRNKEQLTKAKEIIKGLLNIKKIVTDDKDYEVLANAEQFISEAENVG